MPTVTCTVLGNQVAVVSHGFDIQQAQHTANQCMAASVPHSLLVIHGRSTHSAGQAICGCV